MSAKRILVTGATGLIGGHLVSLIKDDPFYSEIIIIARKKIAGLDNNLSLKQYIKRLDDQASLLNLINADVVVCTVGTTIKKAGSQDKFKEVDYGIPLKIAKAASENKCPHFILVSAVGSDPGSKVFYNKVKGELERDLVKIKFKSIHILHPSLLLGDRGESRFGEELAQKLLPAIGFLVPPKYRAIHARVIAAKIKEISMNDLSGVFHYEGKNLYPASTD